MKVIHKQGFDPNMTGNEQEVTLPPGAKIVGFGLQREDFNYIVPQVWYVLDHVAITRPFAEWDKWRLQFVGTGRSYSEDLDYLAGPFITEGLVFHLVGVKL